MVGKGWSIDEIEELLHPQHAIGDCVPACLKSVLNEFTERKGVGVQLRLSEISEAVGCDPEFGTAISGEDIQASLNPEIEDYGVEYTYSYGPEHELSDLASLVASDSASFPVVTVADSWWEEDQVPQSPLGNSSGWEHALVLLDADQDRVQVYDPLAAKLRSDDQAQYIFTVGGVNFLGHWGRAHPTRWVTFLQEAEEPYQKTIGSYYG